MFCRLLFVFSSLFFLVMVLSMHYLPFEVFEWSQLVFSVELLSALWSGCCVFDTILSLIVDNPFPLSILSFSLYILLLVCQAIKEVFPNSFPFSHACVTNLTYVSPFHKYSSSVAWTHGHMICISIRSHAHLIDWYMGQYQEKNRHYVTWNLSTKRYYQIQFFYCEFSILKQ